MNKELPFSVKVFCFLALVAVLLYIGALSHDLWSTSTNPWSYLLAIPVALLIASSVMLGPKNAARLMTIVSILAPLVLIVHAIVTEQLANSGIGMGAGILVACGITVSVVSHAFAGWFSTIRSKNSATYQEPTLAPLPILIIVALLLYAEGYIATMLFESFK